MSPTSAVPWILFLVILPTTTSVGSVGAVSVWRIPETEVKYEVAENSPIGHTLGIVAGPAPQSSVNYAFGAPSPLFELDASTSTLSLKAELDAERLCAIATRRERGDST